VTLTGFELGQNSPGNPQGATGGGAKSGAVSADYSRIDPDLARVNSAWPMLPEPSRRAMLALIETALPVEPGTPQKAAK
jgi:hypothetical protein